jgi:hypothetical protein
MNPTQDNTKSGEEDNQTDAVWPMRRSASIAIEENLRMQDSSHA